MLPGTGCGVLGKSHFLSGAWICPSVQWKTSDLVKFLNFPWQCQHCPHWVSAFILLSGFLWPPSSSLPRLSVSVFHVFISASPCSGPLLLGLLTGWDCRRAVAIAAGWGVSAETYRGHQVLVAALGAPGATVALDFHGTGCQVTEQAGKALLKWKRRLWKEAGKAEDSWTSSWRGDFPHRGWHNAGKSHWIKVSGFKFMPGSLDSFQGSGD